MKRRPSRLIVACVVLLAFLLASAFNTSYATAFAPSATDTDNDGVPNTVEVSGDTDGDGITNSVDPDDDGDGVPTINELPGGFIFADADGDTIPNYLDADDDGDRVPTIVETDGGADLYRDTDGDGQRNYLDADDDADGIPTRDETDYGSDIEKDTDGDGIPDYLDAVFVAPSADLTSLSISAGAVYPAFSPATTSYVLTPVIADGVINVTVTAATAAGSATMQIAIGGGTFIPLTSNQPSNPLQLTGCSNLITVRAINGSSTKDYTIEITRANCTAGPQGVQGDAGPAGPQGPVGISGLEQVTGTPVTILRGENGTSIATCPNGKTVLGGGFSTAVPAGSSARPEAMIVFSSMSDGTTGWKVRGTNTTSRNDGGTQLTLTAYAICAVVAP